MLSAKEVAAIAAKALDAKMGEDIRLIGITDISTLADYFLICTATSSTHVKTLCDAVEEAMDAAGADALPRGSPQRHVGADGFRQSGRPCVYGRSQKVLRSRASLAGWPSGKSCACFGRKRLTNPGKVRTITR